MSKQPNRGRRRSVVLRGLVLGALIVSAVFASHADAQEDERWIVLSRGVLSPSSPMLELNSALAREGITSAPVRVRLHGSVTDGFDGSEIDVLGRRTADGFEPTERFVGRPAGGSEVSTGAGDATYAFADGTDLRFTLNVVALANQHLVTATEMRGRLDGAIEIELSVPESAIPVDAPVAATLGHEPEGMGLMPYGVGGGGLLAGLLLFFGLRKKQAVPPELEMLARARHAHTKLTRDAKALGPQFEGVIAPGDKLLDAAKKSCEHLTELDRALKDASFVKSAAAEARLGELRADRQRALGKLEDVVSGLEEAVVRLAASRADRSAVDGIAGALGKIHDEVTIGREVDAELR